MRDNAPARVGQGSGMPVAMDYLVQSRDALQAAMDDAGFIEALDRVSRVLGDSLAAGHKVLLAGNGGSAGDAQHIAGELVGRLNYDRPALAAVALTTDSSVMTAVANDYGYEAIFERQILGLGTSGDVFIGLSTSGRSPNILRAIAAARQKSMVVIGFTGQSGGDMVNACDVCLCAPSPVTSIAQQIHIIAAHIVCGAVEARLFPRPA